MKLVVVILYLIIFQTDGAKILFISPSLTNSLVMHAGRLADLLVENGHDVTFFIPELVSTHRHNGTTLAKIVRVGGIRDYFLEAISFYLSDSIINRMTSVYKRVLMEDSQVSFCRDLLKKRGEWDYLRKEGFEMVITNSLDFCDIGLVHYLKIPIHIWLCTGPLHEVNNYVLGVPQGVGYLPTLEDNYRGTDFTFLERVGNLWMWITATALHRYQYWKMQSVFRGLIDPNFPDLTELGSNISLIFANDNEFLNFAGPTLHKVISIGGAGMKKPKKLDGNFQREMQKGKNGVILVSFGTAYDTALMKPERKKSIIDVFSSFPDYHFLFKISETDNETRAFAKKANNIGVFGWIPQSDILAHPRTCGFITHGGTNSVIEAAMNGVPMVVIPLFFDQFRNAKMVEYRGLGVQIGEAELSTDTLKTGLKELLYDKKYSEASRRMKKLIFENPNQPDENFLKWIDFALENGPLPELIPSSVLEILKMLKCRKCAAHDVEIAVRGHARVCPYRLCPCDKCLKVVNKRLSSVKRRYKNSDVIFVNVECNSGNVRVQAIPKSLVESLKGTNTCQVPEVKPETSVEITTPTTETTDHQENDHVSKSQSPQAMVSYILNLFAYLKMQPEQQLNFLSTYAWILQTSQFNKIQETEQM
ncbi:hypothetical protein FO519_000557 [Halicephalobus sp. NKZ332]|nr:hypothetical protein FO519_000557 [Halicephalobus sp. NKZ332]